MPPSYPTAITQTIILYLREGINFDGPRDSPAAQTLSRMIENVKSQKGVISQCWGPQVENAGIFVWCIDWEAQDFHTDFVRSSAHNSLASDLAQVFDLERAAPLIMLTRWSYDAISAFTSPVTELAFYSMSHGPSQETKSAIDSASQSTIDAVQTHGKATGAAIGWVFNIHPPSAQTTGSGDWLHGAFGYASIAAHMAWRQTPEHAKVMEENADADAKYGEMSVARVPGVDPETGYFHVHFRREV